MPEGTEIDAEAEGIIGMITIVVASETTGVAETAMIDSIAGGAVVLVEEDLVETEVEMISGKGGEIGEVLLRSWSRGSRPHWSRREARWPVWLS